MFKTDPLFIELGELSLSSLLEMKPSRRCLEAGRHWQRLAWRQRAGSRATAQVTHSPLLLERNTLLISQVVGDLSLYWL